ncbi:MAG: leucine-rich repeat protein [Clostridiales bacterium]|jgi:uncharacterized repeat protein (TIGR02543 family)|nr:leucine-rich repeat protein [Clostridiales bacterium]
MKDPISECRTVLKKGEYIATPNSDGEVLNRVVYVKSLPYYPARKDAVPLESVGRDIAPFASGTPKGAGMLAKEKPVKKGGKIFMTFVGLILLAAAALASGAWAQSYFGKEEVYAVVFSVDGVIYDETTVKKGGEIIFPEVEPAKDGYEFAGWVYEGGTLFEGGSANGNLRLIAKWTAIESYTVSFVIEGLDEPYYEITLGKDEAVIFPEEPTKTGYDFAGWVYEGGTLFEGGSANGNLRLIAKWTVIESYTVSFIVEGLDEPYYEVTLVKDEAVTFPEEPTKTGYDFAGWMYDGGTLFEGGTASGNLILTAKWTETTKKLLGQLKAALKKLLTVEYERLIAESEGYDQESFDALNEAYEGGIEAIEAANYADDADGAYSNAVDEMAGIEGVFTEGLAYAQTENGWAAGYGGATDLEVIIPAVYQGQKVVRIAESGFQEQEYEEFIISVKIPNSVTSIGDFAFCGCYGLTTIDIPEGVTTIGRQAFYDCDKLTTIAIPEGVTEIDREAFEYCDNLTTIAIPEGSRLTSIGAKAFDGCYSLTTIAIPKGVTSIGSFAFASCSSLTTITLPEGVTSIGERTFFSCSSLTTIDIPEGVTSIGEWAFYGCSSLTTIVIPEGVTTIGSQAFYNCSSLTTIVIPEGVTTIGNGVFSGCGRLTIYAEAESKPDDGWTSSWNPLNRPVYWYSKDYKSGNYWRYTTVDEVKVPTKWN